MILIFWLAFAIMLALIGIGIITLKNNENLSIKEIINKYVNKIAIFITIVVLIYIYKNHIPLDKNHGIEYNSEREKLGIPKIGENWENRKYQSGQFTTYWWKPEPRNGHFKKIIEYGILKPKYEIDYYQNKKRKGTFAWSKYNYENNTFEYFLEMPNEQLVSVTEKGNLKFDNPTEISVIDKLEFDKYFAE